MANLKILHLLHKLTFGGTERVIANLVNHAGSGTRHYICSFQAYDDNFLKEIVQPDTVFSLDKKPGNDFSIPSRLARFCKKNSIDIIHSLGWGTYVEGILAAGLCAGKIRFIHSFRGKTIEDTQHIPVRRITAQKIFSFFCDAIIVPSKITRKDYTDMIGINPNRISVIYNGVDLSKFSEQKPTAVTKFKTDRGLPEDCFIIGSVARFDPVKNIHGLIQAFSCLPEKISRRSVLLLVGDGPERSRLQSLTQELGLDKQVIFTGMSSHVNQLLCMMDIYIQPSHFEGVPNAVLEAMAAGKAVIATDVGGVPEVVVHKKTGILVPPKDHLALAKEIQTLYMNRDLCQSMGQEGRRMAALKFSIEKMVTDYESLFSRIKTPKNIKRHCRV